jgi:hypothetical protein
VGAEVWPTPRPRLTDISLHRQYPIIAAEALILFEALRTVPAEARMWIRAKGRGRLNAAELIFLTIK